VNPLLALLCCVGTSPTTDVPGGTDGFDHCYKADHQSSEDAKYIGGVYTESLEGGIALPKPTKLLKQHVSRLRLISSPPSQRIPW
jgi:hypothetical protein